MLLLENELLRNKNKSEALVKKKKIMITILVLKILVDLF